MKKILKKLFLYIKYGYKSTSDMYKKHLIKKGIKVGDETYFYSPWTINIDTQRPWMIEIGNNVSITKGVTILQHDYSWSVLQKRYGCVLGSCGKVKIGNNVFIGVDTVLLKGAEIGDNTIIGANSLVNKKIEGNAVYAGNPVKYIMSLEEYKEKREKKQIEEATLLVKEYYNRYKKYPDVRLLREFFWLFEPREKSLIDTFLKVNELGGNIENTTKLFKETKPTFDGYAKFLEDIEKKG